MSVPGEKHKQTACERDETKDVDKDVGYEPFFPGHLSPESHQHFPLEGLEHRPNGQMIRVCSLIVHQGARSLSKRVQNHWLRLNNSRHIDRLAGPQGKVLPDLLG